jgi:hypothetical protein
MEQSTSQAEKENQRKISKQAPVPAIACGSTTPGDDQSNISLNALQ